MALSARGVYQLRIRRRAGNEGDGVCRQYCVHRVSVRSSSVSRASFFFSVRTPFVNSHRSRLHGRTIVVVLQCFFVFSFFTFSFFIVFFTRFVPSVVIARIVIIIIVDRIFGPLIARPVLRDLFTRALSHHNRSDEYAK